MITLAGMSGSLADPSGATPLASAVQATLLGTVAATNGSGGAPAINTYDEYGIPGAGNVGRTITLDKAEITASGGRIGETLGHEVEHDRLRNEFLPGAYAEARPLGIQYMLGRAPGGSLSGFSGGLRGYVVGRLKGYVARYEHLGGMLGAQRAEAIYEKEQWKPF